MDCVFLGKDGVAMAQYAGTITKVGVDAGYNLAIGVAEMYLQLRR